MSIWIIEIDRMHNFVVLKFKLDSLFAQGFLSRIEGDSIHTERQMMDEQAK